jgi:hypothetical protein
MNSFKARITITNVEMPLELNLPLAENRHHGE